MNICRIVSKTLFFFLILTGFACASAVATPKASGLESAVQYSWNLPTTPVDIVHSLDNKYVFILTADHNVLIYTSQGKLEGKVPVDKGITAIDIAPRAELLYLIDSEKNTFTAMSIDFIRDINTAGSPAKGPEKAPITIVLFTDFECPYCKKVEPLLAQVLERYPNDVRLVFKNMPLQFHKFATPAAKAALAAGEQGKFWEFHDELFAAEKLSDQAISEIAQKLELDFEKWKEDLNNPSVIRQLNTDIQDAQAAGVTGTPTIFINGRLLKQRSMQGFQQVINEELKK